MCCRAMLPNLGGTHLIGFLIIKLWYIHIVQVGSRRQHLQQRALSIFELCFQYNIKLEMEWTPRSTNEIADYISHISDFDDWSNHPDLFRFSDNTWRPHTMDCFANQHNEQLPR